MTSGRPAVRRAGTDDAQDIVEILSSGEDGIGAALWFDVDPQAEPVDDGGAFTKTLGDENARRFFFVLDGLFTAHHRNQESHASLLFAGVRRENQDTGIGSTLLRHHLVELDRTGRPAYLEASSARNSISCQRLGFTKVNDGLSLPYGPTLFPIGRQPLPGQTST